MAEETWEDLFGAGEDEGGSGGKAVGEEKPKEKEKEKKDKKDKEKDKEKKDKKLKKDEAPEKKDKKLKKDKPDSRTEASAAPLLPIMNSEAGPEASSKSKGKEKKDKKEKEKEKKDKKLKKDGKDDKKKDKKDKEGRDKDKKRKVPEAAPSEQPRPIADAGTAAFGGESFGDFDQIFEEGQAAQPKQADAMFDDFGLDDAKDKVAPAQQQRRKPTQEDAFNDVFGDDFFSDMAQNAGAAAQPRGEDAFGDIFAAFDDVGARREGRGSVTPVKLLVAPKMRPKKKARADTAESVAEPWPEALNAKFTRVLEGLTPKKPLSIKDDDAQQFVQEEIKSMLAAAQADEACFGTAAFAKNKLQMLPRVITIMNKYQFALHFVNANGCVALAAWLKFLPDGSLPNDHLRTQLLSNMCRLPITKEALANCSKEHSLGAVVAKLQNHPKETIGNRTTAGSLVQRWLQQVLSKKTPDYDEDAPEVGPQPKLIRPPPESEETLRAIEEESAKRLHPRIPTVGGKEYAIKPVPRDQPIKRTKEAVETNRGKLREVLTVMGRPNKRSWKPYAVSISGQGVNAI